MVASRRGSFSRSAEALQARPASAMVAHHANSGASPKLVSEGQHEPMPNGRRFYRHGCPQAHSKDTPCTAVAVAASPASEADPAPSATATARVLNAPGHAALDSRRTFSGTAVPSGQPRSDTNDGAGGTPGPRPPPALPWSTGCSFTSRRATRFLPPLRRADTGIMRVIFDHFALAGRIMPDMQSDRGAARLHYGASRSPAYQPDPCTCEACGAGNWKVSGLRLASRRR